MLEFEISVLIPVYNTEKYIAQCLESCFSNSMAKNCEFIIVDDCSTDNSMLVAKNVAEKFPDLKENIVWIRHEQNRGSAASRSTALSHAHGKFIASIDADDWVEPDYFALMYREILVSNADVVVCNYWEAYSRKQRKCILPETAASDIQIALLSNAISGYLWNKLLRKSVIDAYKIKFKDGINIWEDLLFLFQYFHYARNVRFLDAALYHYRKQNPISITQSFSSEKFSQVMQALAYIKEFCIQNQIYSDVRKTYLQRCVEAKVIHVGKLPRKTRSYKHLFTSEEINFIRNEYKRCRIYMLAMLIINHFYRTAGFVYRLYALWRSCANRF